jgi:hypothetical protein
VNIKALLQVVQEYQTAGELTSLNVDHPSNGLCFTTKQHLYYEREIIKAITEKHPSDKPLLSEDKLNSYLAAQTHLHPEQQAIKTLISSCHQVMALEGPSGSCKTTLLLSFVELLRLGG